LRGVYKADVLFVDDGSCDASSVFLEGICDNRTFLKKNQMRRGYGCALREGFCFALDAGYEAVVTIDADMQHRPENIPFFLRHLLEWEIVLGSRYISIAKTLEVPQERLLINRYIAGLLKELFGVYFSDPFCGFRGYRASFLRRMQLNEDSYGAGLEILLEIVKAGVVFCELPVESIYFKDGRRFLDGLNNPQRRLLHYLEVISRKYREIAYEKKILIRQPAP